jgi:hypothetical protein
MPERSANIAASSRIIEQRSGVMARNSFGRAVALLGISLAVSACASGYDDGLESQELVGETEQALSGESSSPVECNVSCDPGYILCGDLHSCSVFCYSLEWLPPDPACPAR